MKVKNIIACSISSIICLIVGIAIGTISKRTEKSGIIKIIHPKNTDEYTMLLLIPSEDEISKMCTKNKAIFDVKVIDVEDEITDIKKPLDA
jgi:hypothetical protein